MVEIIEAAFYRRVLGKVEHRLHLLHFANRRGRGAGRFLSGLVDLAERFMQEERLCCVAPLNVSIAFDHVPHAQLMKASVFMGANAHAGRAIHN